MAEYWTLRQAWDKTLQEKEDRPVEPRNYLWASELGKSPIDVYLRLKGVVPTNPPNARSKRKFEAGNIWEWLIGMVLKRAGIYLASQDRLVYQYPDLLEVSGRLDFLAGGKPNFEMAKAEIEKMELPDVFNRAILNIMQYFKENYPEGLQEKVLEIKSVSSFMFDGIERKGNGLKIHRLQLYHYLKSTGKERGDIVYICRDDCRMIEIPVYLGSATEEEYKAEIETLSGYYLRDEMPPKEKMIVFDEDLCKFSKNFRVEYSMYLTMLYGFEDPEEYYKIYKKVADQWNRVLTRLKKTKDRKAWLDSLGLTEADVKKEKADGKKTATIQYVMKGDEKIYVPDNIKSGHGITPANQLIMAEIEKAGFDINDIVDKIVDEVEDEEY